MNTTTTTSHSDTTTRRIASGLYETPDGWQIMRATDLGYRNCRVGEDWHLIDADGEYCDTYATKADALAAYQWEQHGVRS